MKMTSYDVQVMHIKMGKPGNPQASQHTSKDWKRCSGCAAAMKRLKVEVDGKKYY
jgi:hypothetical protein